MELAFEIALQLRESFYMHNRHADAKSALREIAQAMFTRHLGPLTVNGRTYVARALPFEEKAPHGSLQPDHITQPSLLLVTGRGRLSPLKATLLTGYPVASDDHSIVRRQRHRRLTGRSQSEWRGVADATPSEQALAASDLSDLQHTLMETLKAVRGPSDRAYQILHRDLARTAAGRAPSPLPTAPAVRSAPADGPNRSVSDGLGGLVG